MGFKIYATQHTADVLNAHGVAATVLYKVKDAQVSPNIMDYLQERKIDLVINVPMANRRSSFSDILTDGYIIRRQAVEFNIPVITNLQLAAALVEVLKQKGQKRQLYSQPKRVHGRLTLETMVSLCFLFNLLLSKVIATRIVYLGSKYCGAEPSLVPELQISCDIHQFLRKKYIRAPPFRLASR